ncbi:MAG: FHA domain-containing protein [Candidatus Bruticola sp.]
MVFKRILYCLVAFMMSLAFGLMIAPSLIQALNLPHSMLVITILSLFVALLGTVIFYTVSSKLKKIADETSEPDPSLQQQWAWLKPAGVVPRSPYPVNKEQIIIGRDIASDILLCNDSISRRHAEVVRSAEGWRVRDLGSSNGTFVNGQRVDEVFLVEGDVITLGDVNLTFEGPRRPVPQNGPEPVSPMQPIDPQSLGLDTEAHTMPTIPVGNSSTQVWAPRSHHEAD